MNGILFHDKLASQWSEGYLRRSFRARRSIFKKQIATHAQEGEYWLDLGCGTGVLSQDLLEQQVLVKAIDGSQNMLDRAQLEIPNRFRTKINFEKADAHCLNGISTAEFDGAICSSVLEYSHNPNELMRELSRVVRPDGTLLISAPPPRSIVRNTQRVLRFLFLLLDKRKFDYLAVSKCELSRRAMQELLSDNGFALEQTMSFDPIVPSIFRKVAPPSLLIHTARRTNA